MPSIIEYKLHSFLNTAVFLIIIFIIVISSRIGTSNLYFVTMQFYHGLLFIIIFFVEVYKSINFIDDFSLALSPNP
jgi:hypothetical protein